MSANRALFAGTRSGHSGSIGELGGQLRGELHSIGSVAKLPRPRHDLRIRFRLLLARSSVASLRNGRGCGSRMAAIGQARLAIRPVPGTTASDRFIHSHAPPVLAAIREGAPAAGALELIRRITDRVSVLLRTDLAGKPPLRLVCGAVRRLTCPEVWFWRLQRFTTACRPFCWHGLSGGCYERKQRPS
jgi:hypothetical protein